MAATLDYQFTEQELQEVVCRNGLYQHNVKASKGMLLEPKMDDIHIVMREEDGIVQYFLKKKL